jgi:hypothetical protein
MEDLRRVGLVLGRTPKKDVVLLNGERDGVEESISGAQLSEVG